MARPKGLLLPCRGKAEGKQADYLKRIVAGHHPTLAIRMDPPRVPSARFLWLLGAADPPVAGDFDLPFEW